MVFEGQRLFFTRLAVGLTQGLALYLLYHAQDIGSWPATNRLSFGPLLLIWIYPPILLILGIGQIDWRRAALWAIAAAVLIAGLGFYDVWSAWPQDWVFSAHPTLRPHILPSPQLFLFGGAGLFIAHALVIAGHLDHRFRANYETHFDVAWKLAVQLALAGVFVGAFWLLLLLGAGLFDLIKLDFFQKLIRHEWFSIPVTTLAVAGALHLTDIRPVLVRGARTLLLTLLSWLLPLITLIIAGFLASLLLTGLKPLWGFGHASALLLTAAAALIILINAAHQDGHAERLPPRVLRLAGSVAAALPVPLVAIASYALFLRIQEYGWSADRVIVAAVIVVAWGYAVGYVRAAVSPGIWLQRIEDWNFAIALLILAVLMALFTPIAKPERIAVADQMARLNSGNTMPGKFDFAYLRRQGGHYGMAALEMLSKDQNSIVREQAVAYLKQSNPFGTPSPPAEVWTARIHVYPEGSKLPDDFVHANWNAGTKTGTASGLIVYDFNAPPTACTTPMNATCDAFILDLDGDGRSEIVVLAEASTQATVYKKTEGGSWTEAAFVTVLFRCPSVLSALKEGHFELSADPHPWKQIALAGIVLPVRNNSAVRCLSGNSQ